MFNKAFKRVLAGVSVAAVFTLGVPALPALATDNAVPTLALSVDEGVGYTALVGSELRINFTDKNLINDKNVIVTVTKTSGADNEICWQNYFDRYWDNTTGCSSTTPDYFNYNTGGNFVDARGNQADYWDYAPGYLYVDSDAEGSVKIDAFIDMDDNGSYNPTIDVEAASKTVSFIKTENAGLKATINTPVDGQDLEANITSSVADLNLWSITNGDAYDDPYVVFSKAAYENTNDGYNELNDVSWSDDDEWTWNSTTKKLTAYSSNNGQENYYFKAQAYYGEDVASGAASVAKGVADLDGAITNVANDVNVVSTNNVKFTDDNDNYSWWDRYYDVRKGTKSVTVTGTAENGVAGSNVYVEFDHSVYAADTYTVNGTKLVDSNNAEDRVAVPVKADGTYSFTLTTANADNTDDIAFWIDNRDWNANDAWVRIDWVDAVPAITNVTPSLANNSDIALLDKESYTANLELKDQFGAFVTDGTYKAVYNVNGGGNDDVTFTNGKASVTESFRYYYNQDGSPSNERVNVGFSHITFTDLYKGASAVSSFQDYTINFDVRESNVSTFDLGDDGHDYNSRPTTKTLVQGATLTSWDNSGYASAYVDDVYGNDASYAKVTYSAPGLAFVVNDKVYLNSVTVFSDEDGYSSVDILGTKTGDYKLTVSSGTQSYTATYTIEGSNLDVAKAVVVDTMTSELDVTDYGTDTRVYVDFKFFDKYGNPTTATDPGFQVDASIVGDNTISVDFENWDWYTEGSSYNGDNGHYYGRAWFYVPDTFSGSKTLKIVDGTFSSLVPLVIGAPKLTFTAPTAVKAGASIPVTFNLKDANGDPIYNENVTLSLAGTGYLSSNNTSSLWGLSTDKAGNVTVNLITSSVTTGAATITATNTNWDNDRTNYNVDKSASVTVAVVSAVPTTKVTGKNLTVKYAYAAGKKVVLTVDGKVKYSGKPASNKLVSVTKALAKGKHTVVLTIGSLTVVNKPVTVK